MKIRKRNGELIEVGDDYALKDGEVLAGSPLAFMDGDTEDDTRPRWLHDGRGAVAGFKPGFVFPPSVALSDSAIERIDRLEDAATVAFREKVKRITSAWKQKNA